MLNRIKEKRSFKTESVGITIESWVSFFERNRVETEVDYQREYVWKKDQQQLFLNSIISGLPLGYISVVKDKSAFVYEIVDGKQRLTTLRKFVENEISVEINGEEVFYKDLNMAERNMFESCDLPMVRLIDPTKLDKLNYFMMINFGGVAQSEEHKKKVERMILEEIK